MRAARPVDREAGGPYHGDLASVWGPDRFVVGGPGVTSFPFTRQIAPRPLGGDAWLRLRDAGRLAGALGRSLPDAWET